MKKLTILTTIALAAFTLGTGCSQDIDDPVFDYNLKSAEVIETNNDFGLALLNKVVAGEKAPNFMISPASVSIALGMAYNGAESTTRDAFEQVLNYKGLSREEVNEITMELINVLVTNVKGNLLEIANSMWYDKGFPVDPDFINLNSNYYRAQVREIDFRTAEALETINGWASEKTHGKIDKIIQEIDSDVMMILINAIYFNCVWETEFDPEDTRKAPFYNEGGDIFKEVDMMYQKSTLNSAFTEEFSAVVLPYRKGKFSMYLFLPGEGSSVEKLVQQMTGDKWRSLLEGFIETKDFSIHMPKFKFEFGRSLVDDLKSMGLDIAFTNQADFSSMSPVSLQISDVIHKTYIDVNEEGTEAAAATAITMGLTSVGPSRSIRFDRPFLFAITENSSKSILFVGKVSEPKY